MEDNRWDVPQTDEGFQTLLSRLKESRETGDEAAVGRGLLAQAFLLGWVPSENHGEPFARAEKLIDEALEIFERIGDERGRMMALRRASPLQGREEYDRRLAEAMRIADGLGDEFEIAKCASALGRGVGLRDRAEAARLITQALHVFQRMGKDKDAARELFSLSLYLEDPQDGFNAGKEAARLYRLTSDSKQAAKSAVMAVRCGEKFLAWPEMEGVIRQGIADASAGGDWASEKMLYGHLSKVAAAKGDAEEAAECLARQAELEAADGLTPIQRRAQERKMTKMMVEISRAAGNEEGAKLFEKELRRRRRPSQKAT